MRRKLSDNSETVDVAWIPTKFAIVGKVLEIKEADEKWIDGWIVKSVGKMILVEEDAKVIKQEYRDHRSITDV